MRSASLAGGRGVLLRVRLASGAQQPLHSFPEQEVLTKDTMRVDSTGNNTKLVIMKAQRSMNGKYILTAKNKHGEDSVEINLTVLGK